MNAVELDAHGAAPGLLSYAAAAAKALEEADELSDWQRRLTRCVGRGWHVACASDGCTVAQADRPGPWQHELDAFMRAFSGAFLFGIPSLYTLETWELGTFTEPTKLLILLGIALLVSVTLAHFAGFRMEPPTLFRSVDQAVDAVAVGAVSAVVVLAVLSRIGPSETLQANVARVVIQIVPLSMGVAVANAVFARGRARQWEHSEQTGDDAQAPVGPWKATLGDVAATVVGAALLGFSIAPTEEIELIAAELGLANALALVALSLVSTHMIVFASAFDPERHLRRPHSVFRTPLGETLMAYVVSLLVAGLALYMFGRLDLSTPLGYILAQVLVLGLPAAVGGAAGRLVA